MKKLNQKKGILATGSMMMTLAVCHSVSVYASDVEIYSNSTGGQTRIMFVLDTSSSMKATNTMKMACDAPVDDNSVTVPSNNSEPSGTSPSYTRYYCTANATVVTKPKTYRYIRQVVSKTTAEISATTQRYRCGTSDNNYSNSAYTNSTGSCNSSTTLSSNPSGTYCSITENGITYYYQYERSGSWYSNSCNNYLNNTRRYRYRVEPVAAVPATTISTDSCTSGGNVSCGYEYRTCPTDATTLDSCTTVVGSAPSGSYSNESCGTGCTAYFTPAQTTTQNQKFYDRITRLKDGMFAVLQGTNDVAKLTDDVIAGLTDYATVNSRQTGRVLLTAKRLDAPAGISDCNNMTQRQCMLKMVAGLGTNNNFTATARAYGVAAKSLIDTIGNDTSECNGNGIYYLTDGGPTNLDPTDEMRTALGSFSCPSNFNIKNLTDTNSVFEYKSSVSAKTDWRCIAKFTNELLNGSTTRPKIKTAAVGFGKLYAGLDPYTGAEKNKVGQLSSSNIDIANINARYPNISNSYATTTGGATRDDIANTALWGVYGRGGWYSASEADEVAKSILNFVDEVKPEFEPVTTGSPTLPQDALNPLRIQPYGYYASFTPTPQETFQLWAGNLNKYHIHNGELYDIGKSKPLIKSNGSMDSTASGLWAGGILGKLPLGLSLNAESEQVASRTIYTNRQITDAAPYTASDADTLKKINVTTLFGTDSTALFANDPDKNYWLNLLGYNVGATETGVTLASLATKPELRQVGAVMHSTPILLTQRGKITVSTSGALDTTVRDDYLLFGSTQGLLHVIDADTGVEKFAFVPNEMMQNQKGAFLSETRSTSGSTDLFYGIDAPWTAYTQYVSKADGTLTVNSSDRTGDGTSDLDLTLKGLQWVYGGLRMGGRSYYALDLSDLDKPSLKFHINPDAAVNTGTTIPDTNNALSYMGQSWSKPTLAYVKFGGVKKLVMFVGGGYDSGYEDAAYDQNTTTGGGAGVYMFSAGGEDQGKLLWWASANATAAKGAEAFTDASTTEINMKYSVVSQINAIDRNNDGLVDHLYFGDLGGQAFRVDLNNAATGDDASAKKANFAKRVVRLFTEHASGGKSPRFYEMPSVSIHEENGYVAAVAFSSGNRSSPLVGIAAASGRNNQAGSTVSADDGVFVVYDKDVAKSNLYTLTDSSDLTTKNIMLASLNTNMSSGVAITGNNGWKYIYSNTAGVYKGMNELYAIDNILYVNVYHRDGAGIGGTCGAGVKGDSYIYQFCLPIGKCSFATTTSGEPNKVKLGAGILGSGIGQSLGSSTSKLVVPRPNSLDCTTAGNKNKPECQEFTTTAKLRQLRWYESH